MPAEPIPAAADERLTVMGLLAETYAGLARRWAAELTAFGLSLVEFEVLLRLARSPEGRLRMSDLAAQASVTVSGVTRVVDRLVVRGLVGRTDCPTDRRTVYAVLTPAGQQLMAEVIPAHLELIEQGLTGPLAATGLLDDFSAALRRVRDLVAPCATVGTDGVSTRAERASSAG